MKKTFTFFSITNSEEGRTNVEKTLQLTRNQAPHFLQYEVAGNGKHPGYYTYAGFRTHSFKYLKRI